MLGGKINAIMAYFVSKIGEFTPYFVLKLSKSIPYFEVNRVQTPIIDRAASLAAKA